MPLFASFAGHQFLLTSKMKNNIQTVRNQLLFINGGAAGGGGERGKGRRRIFLGDHMVSRGSGGDQSSSTKYEGRTIEH